jgi:glycine/serine hydroxymethyltransferase
MTSVTGADVIALVERLVQNESRADTKINLVPSENSCSVLSRIPFLLDVNNRYFFNVEQDPTNWMFRGGEALADVEGWVTGEFARLLSADYATVRPLSGIHAMFLVFAAFGGPPGSDVVTVAHRQGGHMGAWGIADRLNLRRWEIGGPSPHEIDLEDTARVLREHQPRLVYIDQSCCLFPANIAALRACVDENSPDSILHADVSHFFGLVLGGALPNPLESGADTMSASTHKTFPGPQKAVVATRREDLWKQLDDALNYVVSSQHFGGTVTLALSLMELLATDHVGYAAKVVQNTQQFAAMLHKRGLLPAGADRGYSAGHQVWVAADETVDIAAYGDRLALAGILTNVVPDLPDMPNPSLRLGIQEATYWGFGEPELRDLADVFGALTRADADVLAARAVVTELCERTTSPYQLIDGRGARDVFLEEITRTLKGSTW